MKKGKTKKNENPIKKSPTNRRDFLMKSWKFLGVIAGIQATGLTLHFLSDRKVVESENTFEIFDFGEIPLNSVTPFRSGKFYLVRTQEGGFLALSLYCSHLGCSIIWDEKQNTFQCPCHSSKFDVVGNVINPPASRALDFYKITEQSGKLIIDLNSKQKRSEFDRSQLTFI